MTLIDVRMKGFASKARADDLSQLLDDRLSPLETEPLELSAAANRVLAEDVISPVAVPSFDRSAMDGYALRWRETVATNHSRPLTLQIIGIAKPGEPFPGVLGTCQAVAILTGAALPTGADSVVRAEDVRERDGWLRVGEAVQRGLNVTRRGEDIEPGSTVLTAGRVLRPQDLGLLASIGKATVEVIRRPTVDLFVTGNELLPCGSQPEGDRIVDSNSIMLDALVRRDGGLPGPARLIPDRIDALRTALLASTADLVLISGGSSVGPEDYGPGVLAEVGELCIHGVAVRPASPTGLGFLGNRPVFLVPGNPVSCLCCYDLFIGGAVRRLGGRSTELPYRTCRVPLAFRLMSVAGRTDYVRVRLRNGKVEPLSAGRGSGASILSSTTRADGFVLVPHDAETLAVGEQVQVFLYDAHPAMDSPPNPPIIVPRRLSTDCDS